ncbi:hemagglutinin [Caballeronia glebae]|uniref:Hemagglutinin n=1 Tax=Caballeronia glebae TaxID=1777143 RepID=A0A157ZCQ9_9BURK|nr:ESPR-type extended signal peptide-containing protein [Caballeronia glebae]SAK43304.1 hemagglutinin [Caballeronia glebae]
MNKIYRIVWNCATGGWAVASETAKGRTKSSGRTHAVRRNTLLKSAIALGSVIFSGGAFADASVGYEYGGTDYCAHAGSTLSATGCSSWGPTVTNFTGANISYLSGDSTGATGGVWAADNNAGIWYGSGANGTNRLYLNSTGTTIQGPGITLNSASGVNMSSTQMHNLAAGTAATDATNVSQITPIVSALGGGATFNSGTGAVTGPSYALSNANIIAGTSGAATDVGMGFGKVDAALGSLNSSITNINNGGGIKYFRINSALPDSVNYASDSIAVGGGAIAGVAGRGYAQIVAIGANTKATGAGAITLGGGATTIDGYLPNSGSLMAIGYNATSSYGHSIAIGANAVVTPATNLSNGLGYATGLGDGVLVTQAGGTATGANSSVTAAYGSAFGYAAATSSNNATAVGVQSSAAGAATVAVGSNAKTVNDYAIAIGNAAQAKSVGDVALGASASADNGGGNSGSNYATALGANATVSAGNGTAVGNAAKSTASNGLALGALASASSANSVALGSNSTTTANLTIAGYNPGAGTLSGIASTANGEVSLGSSGKERRLTNVAAGASATDAVNVSQLQSEVAKVNNVGTTTATALGGGANYNTTTGALTGPSYALGNANSIAGTSGAATDVGTGFGKVDAALGKLNTSATTAQSTADAANTTANKGWNLSTDGGASSQNIAPGATANFAAGTNATVTRSGNTVTVGVVANPTFAGMVTANGGLTVSAGQTVNMGGNKVNNVAAGVAATDAVNMSQLNATNAAVTQNTTDIATNTTNIAGNTTSINDINNQINNGTIGLVQQAAPGADLTVGKNTDGKAVDFADVNGNARTLKSVKAGVADTDAVNMSQLNTTNAAVAQNTTDIATNTTNIATNTTDIATNTTNIAGNTTSINDINNQINNGTIGLVQQAAPGADLTVGKNTDGKAVDFADVSGNARTLKSVKAGVADTDAVNMSQLNTTNAAVTQNTTDIAGNTTSINDINNQINNGTIGLVQQAAPGADLTVGKNTDGKAVDFADVSGNARTLKSVKAGVADTDAVNMSQLNTTNAAVAQNTTDIATNTTNIAGNTTSINDINNQINNGTIGLVQQAAPGADLTVGKNTDGKAVDFADVNGNARALKSVKAGVADTDAVNMSQLNTTNAAVAQNTTDIAGNTTSINDINNQINNGAIGLVQQDAITRNINVAQNTDGTVVNFAGLSGARVLDGVAAGAVTSASKQAVNGSQLYALASSTASAMGGGSTVNSDGSVTAPTYTVNGNVVNNVGDAISNIDARTTQNTTDIANIGASVTQNTTNIANLTTNVANNTTQIAQNTTDIADINNQINSGTIGLVQQDANSRTITVAKNTDGTVVDMTGTQGARTVTGVAAGTLAADSTDAVNGSQLYATNQQVTNLSTLVQNVSGANSVLASDKTDTPAVASGSGSTAIGNGANASGANSVALGSGSVADQDNTVSVGSQGNERRITNVAPGVNGTDAANMNQVASVQSSVNSVARAAYSGVAAAMAMPNLTPREPGKTIVAAGVANYKGYTAMGVGGTYRSQDSRWLVNGALSLTPHGDTGVRAQVGYEF